MSHDATLAELDAQFGPINKASSRLKAPFLKDFLAMEIPAREPLIDPILPRQGLMMIHAPRGIGKTFFALNLAYAVASGTDFLKYRVPKACGVLYVDGEMPAATLHERLAAIVDSEIPDVPLRLVTPDLNLETGIPDISSPEGQSLLDEVITNDIKLIIIDNLSCLCRSGKENEAESWSFVQSWALRQRAAGRSVIFIHHSGKTGLQRGTSRREDVLDTVLSLRRPKDYDASEGARFEVHIEKGRTLFGEVAQPFETSLETDDHGYQVWQMTDLADNRLDQFIPLFHEGKSDSEIAEIVGVDRTTVYRRRRSAKADGLL